MSQPTLDQLAEQAQRIKACVSRVGGAFFADGYPMVGIALAQEAERIIAAAIKVEVDAATQAQREQLAQHEAERPGTFSPADIESVAAFVVGYFPDYEDALAWGSSGPRGIDETHNEVYQAGIRLLSAARECAALHEPKPDPTPGEGTDASR